MLKNMKINTKIVFILLTLILVTLSYALYYQIKYYRSKILRHDLQVQNLSNLDVCNESINRMNFINSIPKNLKTLEIGPYFSPNLEGENVKYFDVLDKEALIESAKLDPNIDNLDRIPNIDFVEPYGDLSIIKEKFDTVYSSHNIEHQVNLIKHFNQIYDLLNEGGKFYLFIPDKRYCFDHYIPETPLSEIVATNHINSKHHSLQTILAMECETTHNDAKKHWNGDSGLMIRDNTQNCYYKGIEKFENAKGSYIDSHKWRFTPKSFTDIIDNLYKMKLIKLKIVKVYCTEKGSHEFSAILKKIE